MATFPGKGSDDVVEQAEGKMQTGCRLLRLPVKFEQNHIFSMHFCESKTRARAFLLEAKQCQCHIGAHVTQCLTSLHFLFCY